MEIVNGYVGSLTLTPNIISDISFGLSTSDINNCSIHFFSNGYDNSILSNCNKLQDLLDNYNFSYIGSCSGLSLRFLYDENKKQRIIQQVSIDAIRFNTVNDGIINWCCIDIGGMNIDNRYFIFSDSIGTFDEPLSINVNNLQASIGIENIVNGLKIDLRSKSIGEI